MNFVKGHLQCNTGRTWWRSGHIPWNKGLNITLKPKTGGHIVCENCGKERYCQKWEIKKRKFCSRKCYFFYKEKNPSFGYQALHTWVKEKYGKAKKCIVCNSIKNIDWANKSSTYQRNINDWIQLCRKDHIAYDRGKLCVNFQ